MKIRNGYVSNSSSSSFLVSGIDLKKTLELNKNNNEMFIEGCEYNWDDDSFTIGELVTSMLGQIEEYNNDKRIIEFIESKIYDTCSQFYESLIPDQDCNTFHWDDTPANKMYEKYYLEKDFDITDDIKNLIKEKFARDYDKHYYFYLDWDTNELDKNINDKINELTNKLYTQTFKNKECYIFSYGDNHGIESGSLGAVMEYGFLGKKYLNTYLKSNFDIYQNNEH